MRRGLIINLITKIPLFIQRLTYTFETTRCSLWLYTQHNIDHAYTHIHSHTLREWINRLAKTNVYTNSMQMRVYCVARNRNPTHAQSLSHSCTHTIAHLIHTQHITSHLGAALLVCVCGIGHDGRDAKGESAARNGNGIVVEVRREGDNWIFWATRLNTIIFHCVLQSHDKSCGATTDD